MGKLDICRVLQHLFGLPDGHRRIRWLRTESLEQDFSAGIFLELVPDVGQPVAGRDLPQARRVARVARAYYPEAQAGPDHIRTPREEGLEDDIGEVGLLRDYLLQPLARNRQHLPAFAHHGRDVHGLPGEHVQFAQEAAGEEGPYRPRLAGEVVYHLHYTFQDDDKVVGGVARPEEDVPDVRLPRLFVEPEDRELVFPQRRGPRTSDLVHSIIHGVP